MKNEINLVINPRDKDIGIPVRRVLPWATKRMVGPFIFLDEMGPVFLHPPKDRLDVRPHPHIGLSTLTYLFEGSMLHRDSLGFVQEILPGEANWMTAGKGISHSERETDEVRKQERTLHGLQFWVALPKHAEDMEPEFYHYGNSDLPQVETESSRIDVVAGTFGGASSPLKIYSPLIFLTAKAKTEGVIRIPANGFELGMYVVEGEVKVDDNIYRERQMLVFKEGSEIEFHHSANARVAIIGGEKFPEERYIWWNLVSSSKEKIEAAKRAWEDGSFPQVPGEHEKIPLPKD